MARPYGSHRTHHGTEGRNRWSRACGRPYRDTRSQSLANLAPCRVPVNLYAPAQADGLADHSRIGLSVQVMGLRYLDARTDGFHV